MIIEVIINPFQEGLANGVKQLLVIGQVVKGFANDFTSENATFSALAGDAQGVAYVTHRAGSIFDGCTNLGIGNAFTNAYVHC